MWTIITTLLGAAIGGILGFSGSYFSQKKASDFYEAQERKRIYREKLEILFERFCYLENAVLIVFRFKSSPKDLNILFQKFGDILSSIDNDFSFIRMLTATYAPEIIDKSKVFSKSSNIIIDLMADYRDIKLSSTVNSEEQKIIDSYLEAVKKIKPEINSLQILSTELKIILINMIKANL